MAAGTRKRLCFLAAVFAAVAAISLTACQEEEKVKGDDFSRAATIVNQMQGVTDTEIRIGTLVPLSANPAAAWGIAISKGMQAYFDYIND